MAVKKLKIGLGSFDFIKGYCLLTIILGHSANCYDHNSRFIKLLQLLIYIGISALPLFMIVSGYSFRENTVTRMLKKTFSELIVPYCIIGMAYVLICPFSYYPVYHSWQRSFELAKRFFFAFLFGNKESGKMILGIQTEWNTAAWFFLALFIAQNLLNLILKIKSKKIQIGCVITCYILYLIFNAFDWNILSIADGLWALPLCYAGYLLKKHRCFSHLLNRYCAYIVLALLVVTLHFVPEVNFPVIGALFDFLYSLFSGILLLILGVLIGNRSWTILEPIKSIGTYSYWILSVHAVEMQALPWSLLQERLSFRLPVEFCIEMLIKALIITVGCMILKLISRARSKRYMNTHPSKSGPEYIKRKELRQ